MPKHAFTSLLLLVLPLISIGQADTISGVRLLFLSNTIRFPAKQLDKEISGARNLETVKSIVRKRVADSVGTIVVFFKKDNSYFRWERNLGKEPRETTSEWLTLGIRGSGSATVNGPEDFATLFVDTLVIFDTLAVLVKGTLRPEDLGYRSRITCDTGVIENEVPVSGDRRLLFTGSNLSLCNDRTVRFDLSNSTSPSQILATCELFFPDDALKAELISMAKSLQQAEPALPVSQITAYLQSYIAEKYGYCVFEHLRLWMTKFI